VVPFPSEWPQSHGVDIVTTFPPELGARFRWYARQTPQAPFSAIVERVLASDPDFQVRGVGDSVRAITREGEYAAWVAVDGRRQGVEAVRYIGAVFLDHFVSVLDCLALVPEHFSRLKELSFELLRSSAHQLTARPRPFYYEAPLDWQALPSGATATWYPPDYPRNLANIAVAHAVRIDTDAATAVRSAFATASSELAIVSSSEHNLSSTLGHDGSYLELRGHDVHRAIAMFVVDGRAYRMRLETGMSGSLAQLRELFRAMAISFRPLPTLHEMTIGRAFAKPSQDFDHWAT